MKRQDHVQRPSRLRRNVGLHPSGATAPGAGGPAYDATIDPLTFAPHSPQVARLARQRDLYHYGNSVVAAQEGSYYNGGGNGQALAMMGLAANRDLLEAVTSRTLSGPFPGVELGPTPSFAGSPDTTPPLGGVQHLRFNAHNVESARATRARFGR
jgi:hypothetical protein